MPDNAMHFRVTGLKILETFLDNLEKKKGGGGGEDKEKAHAVIYRSS